MSIGGATTAHVASSRRDFLRRSAVVAAIGGGVATGFAQPASASALERKAAQAMASATGSFLPADPDLHLLRRTTFGITPDLVTRIKAMGHSAWLEQQLAPGSISDNAMDTLISSRFPRLSYSIAQAISNIGNSSWGLMMDLGTAALARAAWSQRQLFEVMVDFWSNHLNVANPSDSVWATRHDYDRKVIRANALGKFSDMLVASATHPAMMTYLNNAESTKDSINENYGRELLELHTVGLGAGYTQDDMSNSVNVMTGFGIRWNTYQFHYSRTNHFVGPVQVLGWSSPNATPDGGYQIGLGFLNYLSHHPSTASHISYKLCQRFVADAPPDSLVSALATTYLANDTAIVPVLRQLFNSPEFATSIGQKVRRPMESVVATVRDLGIGPDKSGSKGMKGLYWMVDGMANAPLAWRPPNGYPDFADSWRSAGGTLGRWNSNIDLAAHWWPKTLTLPPLRNLLPGTLPATYGGYVDALSQRLLFTPMQQAHVDAVLAFIGKHASDPLKSSDEALGWRFPYIVSLLLDSPYHQLR